MRFDSNGNLIGGIIDCNILELKELLVDNVANVSHRNKLYNQFINMFNDEIIKGFLNCLTKIYIDGSFCTNKEYPGDIDIIALIDLQNQNGFNLSSNEDLQKQLRSYIKKVYNVDFLCTPDSSTLDQKIEQYDEIYDYLRHQENGWIKFFSTDRNENKKALVKLNIYEGEWLS